MGMLQVAHRLGLAMLAAATPAIAEPPPPGHCMMMDKGSVCVDYLGSFWRNDPVRAQFQCSGPDATWYPGEACPIESPWDMYRIGSCIMLMEKPLENTMHFFTVGGGGYADPDFDQNWLRMGCQNSGGTWVWGPAKR